MVEVTRFDRCSPKISNFLNNQEATVISDQTFNPLAAAILIFQVSQFPF